MNLEDLTGVVWAVVGLIVVIILTETKNGRD